MGIDPSILGTQEDININGVEFTFSNQVPPNGYTYHTDDGGEAIITYNKVTGNMFATVKKADGTSFVLEKCSGSHVWKEFEVSSFKLDRAVNFSGNPPRKLKFSSDNSTVVTYTVMFYYTADFASQTSDIPGFIDQVLAETNQGYINSQVPVRVARYFIFL